MLFKLDFRNLVIPLNKVRVYRCGILVRCEYTFVFRILLGEGDGVVYKLTVLIEGGIAELR